MSGEVPGYAELEFDLPRALLNSLVSRLDHVQRVPLLQRNTSEIPEEQGVYQLFHKEVPVYVGKTDAKAGLMIRLTRHSRKVQHRVSLDPADVTFKAIRVFVFTAVDIEGDLIRHYGGNSGLAWNGSGFGSNDPGRERDTTKNKPENFDYQHPIDIDRPLDFGFSPLATAADALNLVRANVPYTVRPQRHGSSRKLHLDLESTMVECSQAPMTTRQAVEMIVGQLPGGWQATKLLGYLILYKEERSYPDADVIARS